MKFTVRVSDLAYGSAVIEAANEAEARKIAETMKFLYFDAENQDMTVEPADPNEPVTDDRTYVVTEMCPHCMNEIEMHWNTNTMGFKAICPVCGGRLMLCDECQHTEGCGGCDYDGKTDTCKFNQKKETSLSVETPLGTIRAESTGDPERPGIEINLTRDGLPPMRLTRIEFTQNPYIKGWKRITGYAWGDSDDEDYTNRIIFEGVEDFFHLVDEEYGSNPTLSSESASVTQERPILTVNTPLGVLCAETTFDPEHPGIAIDLMRGKNRPLMPLALIEFTRDNHDFPEGEPHIIYYAWGDSSQEDYTEKVAFQGIDDFFRFAEKTSFPAAPKSDDGYSKDALKEPFVWEHEDWTAEEWAVLCKICGLPADTTDRIVLRASEVESFVSKAPTGGFKPAGVKSLEERDKELEKIWAELEDVPMDPDTERLEDDFYIWPHGTDREEIWHWFDERHSKGIAYLLYKDGVDRTCQTSKLVHLSSLCFECESTSCQYNHDGECRFAMVHERAPKITEEDGCVDFDYNEGGNN